MALQKVPLLNYQLSRTPSETPHLYRFLGAIEAVSNEGILWVRSEGLTAAVSMNRARIFLVPPEDAEDGFLQRLTWRQLPLILEGSKIFIGGPYCSKDGRKIFCSTKEHPLIVLLFEGDEQNLVYRVLAAARQPNEYWNKITPYSLVLGMFSQLLIAASYSGRPALRLTALTALASVFIPIMPLLPPGVLFTSFYRRWWRRARHYRAYRDMLEFFKEHNPTGDTEMLTEMVPAIGPMEKKAGFDPAHIQVYRNRSCRLVLYAIAAAGFGIVLNILVILFVLQSLFL